MITNKLSFLISLWMIVGFSANAMAQETRSLTIDQAITIGLENSKALHASMMKVEYADAKESETNALRLPTIKAGASYTRLSEVPPFSIGPIPPILPNAVTVSSTVLDNYNLRMSLQQPLFTGFRLLSSSNIADYTLQAAERDFQKDKADLVYNIRNAYWNLFKAKEFKNVIDENVEQMKSHLKDVQNFYNQGIVTKNEVLKVEVQLSNIQLLQVDANNNVRLAMIGLNSIIGLPLTTTIELSSEVTVQDNKYQDLPALVSLALEERPDIKSMENKIKAGESAVTLARSGWYPQIYLSGNYTYARPNSRIFPTVDKFNDTWDVTLSASLDIWNWGTTIHQTDQAKAQLAQAQDGFAQMKDGVTLDVTQNYLNVGQAKEKIGVAEKGVGQAEENYRITNEKFKSGLALNSDLIDAEAALLQAKFNRIQSMIDYELADARLQKALGEVPNNR
jgi:outer membrane protein